jgi:hypothetical protein
LGTFQSLSTEQLALQKGQFSVASPRGQGAARSGPGRSEIEECFERNLAQPWTARCEAHRGSRPPRAEIISLAARCRVPANYWSRSFTEIGGLISYGPYIPDEYRRAALYVDRILKGAKPSELPVQAPTKFELVINLKTAKALGLEVASGPAQGSGEDQINFIR